MRSASSLVREFLLDQPEGTSYTVLDLVDILNEKYPGNNVTEGGVSGFFAKLSKLNIVSTTRDLDTRRFRYTLEDRSQLEGLYARGTRGSGSPRGGTKHHSRRDVPPTPATLGIQLLNIAAELEKAAVSIESMSIVLDKVPTEALLAELLKREKRK